MMAICDIPKIAYLTIWQPSDKHEGENWHNSMMDQLQLGHIPKFLPYNEEKCIQELNEF